MLEKAGLVAELYYIYNLPQKKIAQQLGISRPWVSKLLKRAVDEGMVTIEVKTASAGVLSLEEKMKAAFPIRDIKVVRSSSDLRNSTDICGRAAAHYLISLLEETDTVAFSWGYTLASLAEQFPEVALPSVTLVPLVGGMGENTSILSNHIVGTIAKRTHAQSHLLHLPAFVAGQQEKEFFLRDPQVKNTVTLGENADVIVCSIGNLSDSTMVQSGYITPHELKELDALGAVGDIALHFMDSTGAIVDHPIHDRLISSKFDLLRSKARVSLGVALGARKVPAIHAALSGHNVDVFITDSDTAEQILIYHQQAKG